MNRRSLLAALSLSLCPALQAQVRDLNDAINKAGRQRMLSQRVAKAYLALGQSVQKDWADKVLGASMSLFDRQLVELKSFAPTAEIKTTYGQLEAAWSDYKAALVGAAPTKSGAEGVVAQAGKVLSLAHQGTTQLESTSTTPVGKLVNIAGRQRMLSQRMAAFYLSASWGVQVTLAGTEIAKAREEFLKAHELLKGAPEATDAIRSELALAEQQFGFYDAALRNLKPGATDVQAMGNVFTTSERILQVMDGVTGMYARVV